MSLNEDVERAAQRSTELAEMSDAQRIDLLRSELAEAKAALEAANARIANQSVELESLDSSVEGLRSQLTVAKARIAALEGEFTRLNDSLGGALREVIDLRNEKMCLQVAACSIEARAERAEAECKALREVLDNSQSLLVAMLVEHRPFIEIEKQITENRAALNPKESSNGP